MKERIEWYRKQKINLIPLKKGEKAPLIAWDEFRRRNVTEGEIEEWLARGVHNFGAVCGSISNNLFVIDIDQKELFSQLKLEELASETFTVKTKKGYHIYLRMRDPNKKSLVWNEKEEIRFQGEGKYVVCAGSIHPSGTIYEPFLKSPQEIRKAEHSLLKEIENRWKKYHGIDKVEEKREIIKFKTKRSKVLEDFKKRVSLTDIVRRYVSKVNNYGAYWQGLCPFHHEHHPSFTVYENTKSYYCFGCERHGDVISFIEEKESKSFVEAVKRIEEITGVKYYKKEIEEEKKREIYPYEVEEIIRAEKDFITLRDTEEVLHYENSAGGAWRFDGESLIKKKTEEILKNRGLLEKASRYFASEVIGHVQRNTYIERERLNTEEKKINLLNGVYDLETDQLLPHDASYYFTYLIPVQYNENLDCPRIKKFLGEILNGKDIQIVLQFIGYCMLPIMPFHRALMFLGQGANGKSTLIELIRHFLGRKNTCSHSIHSIIEGRFTAAYLYGRLANLYADIECGTFGSTGKFKVLTGGDMLSAEKKFKEPFTFKNTTKLIFSANSLPITSDDSSAFYRRWLIISFPHEFAGEKCDTQILKKLTTPEELSGLLNLVLKALKTLLMEGDFNKSKPIEKLREEYLEKSDPVQGFANKCLEVDPSSFEPKEAVYLACIDYCRETRLPQVNKKNLSLRLPTYVKVTGERKKIHGKQVRCWKGIRLVKGYEERKRDQSLEEQHLDVSVIGDSMEEYKQEAERKEVQEYPLVDSSQEKTDSSKEETQEASSKYPSGIEIKNEVLNHLTSSGTVVTLGDLIEEVHRRTGYSVEMVRECIERLVKGKWIEKDGQYVSCWFDSWRE